MKFFIGGLAILFVLAVAPSGVKAQTNTDGSGYGAIPTAVPFLNISPDSRSGAMGDAGVAISSDVNANFWNPSKLAFIDNDFGVSASYSPWLRGLVPDVSLSYLSFGHKLDDRNVIGASVRYFNLGDIQLVDQNQLNQGVYRPNEYSIDASLARKFGNNLSLGLTMRFIHSDLSNASFATGTTQGIKPANAFAADISMFYKKPMEQFGTDGIFAFGANISNIGTKVKYSEGGPSYFLPTNLKLGAADTWNIDDYNQITLTVDFNKLLVPTPPLRDANGNIISGRNPDVSVPSGIFGSFTDAPGGFKEEIREVSIASGLEYWYNQQFALRGGYFYENPSKGGRQYATLGLGLKYDIYRFDFSYLAASQKNSPLANTLRVSIGVSFGNKK
ncbi:type IX secretion system outer membrane channel protein PorV [Mucilaginibacter auburnensis]|uniref:Type IX secretion system protein PorV domain-containing protein n=1 Tax=Mucilaginibacter auburnensis TaxID=1457233 RepID=A0A2H9VSJ6_9SPHI|nr:type IX secretion system outer membrane channel protein PorV [Mucilaginibacter auburnensis]PJJ83762.1 hypothetical protein CLV57_0755 [Mucilaginibacter auburnensis]